VEFIINVGFESPYLSDFQSACDAGESIATKDRVVPYDAQLENRPTTARTHRVPSGCAQARTNSEASSGTSR
jgi:hypothetical protein